MKHTNRQKQAHSTPAAMQQTAQNSCRTGPQKTEAPAHLHDQMKTGTRGIYMLVSLMHKLTGTAYPDGDVLHIDGVIPAEENRPFSRPAAACKIPQRYFS